jgi:uroporphyrinogen-III synthase
LDNGLHAAAAGQFDWIIFTSANAVQAVAQRLPQLALTPGRLSAVRLASVGSATAQAIQRFLGLTVHLVPDEYLEQALIKAFGDVVGQHILVIQADHAATKLTYHLTLLGAAVCGIATCQLSPGYGGIDLPALLAAGQIDVITLTSPSIVRNFIQRLARERVARQMLDSTCIACIGPTTAQAARELGVPVTVVPAEYTIAGMVDALEHYFCHRHVFSTYQSIAVSASTIAQAGVGSERCVVEQVRSNHANT